MTDINHRGILIWYVCSSYLFYSYADISQTERSRTAAAEGQNCSGPQSSSALTLAICDYFSRILVTNCHDSQKLNHWHVPLSQGKEDPLTCDPGKGQLCKSGCEGLMRLLSTVWKNTSHL